MADDQKLTPPEEPASRWQRYLTLVWIVIFGVLCLLLVQRMVHYRFFSGGYWQVQHQQ